MRKLVSIGFRNSSLQRNAEETRWQVSILSLNNFSTEKLNWYCHLAVVTVGTTGKLPWFKLSAKPKYPFSRKRKRKEKKKNRLVHLLCWGIRVGTNNTFIFSAHKSLCYTSYYVVVIDVGIFPDKGNILLTLVLSGTTKGIMFFSLFPNVTTGGHDCVFYVECGWKI